MDVKTVCPKCNNIGYCAESFCNECGGRMVPMPTCNWCHKEIQPSYKYCGGCGRTREEALRTWPPAGRLEKWLRKRWEALEEPKKMRS